MIESRCKWIEDYFNRSGMNGIVIGLSGGLDSAVVAYLITKAIGKNKICGLIMPCCSNPNSEKDAKEIANILKINYQIVNLEEMFELFQKKIYRLNSMASANLKARLRMITLYAFANNNDWLVAGTENKIEHLLGYFTKWGDQCSDFEPIIDLTKTEVRELSKKLDMPKHIIDKPPSADLWEGQTDEKELGFSYEIAEKILNMMNNSNHKRTVATYQA